MSTFANAAADLLTYCHSAGDATAMKRCLVQALRQLRARRTEWGEGQLDFVTEAGIAEYRFGNYPRLPGGIMALTTTLHASYSALAGAVLEPDTLVSSTNLEISSTEVAAITALQDSAESPDDTWLNPDGGGATDFVVRWDVALARPLLPGTHEGSGAQIMRLAAYNEGTDRVVTWIVKEGATTIASGSWTVNSSSPAVYEAKWDAAKLSTLNPAANQISLTVADADGTEVHFGAVQWFTRTRDASNSVTGGSQPLKVISPEQWATMIGGRVEVLTAVPRLVALFNDRFQFYPTPNGAYRIHGPYQKDSTRDETTNALISTTSTTETNEWFRDGYMEVVAKTLEIYYALRPHDAKAMALAQLVSQDSQKASSLAFEMGVFNSRPRGRL